MSDNAIAGYTSRTKGRAATEGVIPGRFALSVGAPELPCPQGWRWSALSEVAQLESGHTPSRKHPEYWNEGIPWIGIKDAVDNHGSTVQDTYQHVSELGLANSSARLLPSGTVCLSRTASVGFVVVMGRPMATSQDFVNWVCGPALEPLFLKYVLLAERESLLRFASGTTHQTIYYPEAKAFHVLLPPLEEQRAILRILCPLDDKIELNRQTNETLEAIARALFKSWFVDFDPVRGKMEGTLAFGMDIDIAALFPSTMVDSEIGPMPSGWRAGRLDDMVVLQRGFDLPTTSRIPGPYSVIQASGPSDGHVEAKVRGPGVVTGRSGVLGKVFLVMSDFWPLNTTLWVKEFRASSPCHAYFLLQYIDYHAFNAGSAVPTLNRNHVHGLPFVVPPNNVVSAFDQLAMPLFSLRHSNDQESARLTEIRDLLLPRLLSGELRVRDAERIVGAVV